MKNRVTVYNKPGDRIPRKNPLLGKSVENVDIHKRRQAQQAFIKNIMRDKAPQKNGRLKLQPINDASSRVFYIK